MHNPQELEALASALLDEIEVLATDVQGLGADVIDARAAVDQSHEQLQAAMSTWESELADMLDQAKVSLDGMYEMVQALTSSVADHYTGEVDAAGERLTQTRDSVAGLFDAAAALVESKRGELAAATTALTDHVVTIGSEHAALADQVETELVTLRDAVNASAEAAGQAMDQQRSAVEQTRAAIETQQQELAAHIEDSLLPALEQSSEEFAVRISEITQDVVLQGIESTRDAALQTLDTGVKAVVDQTVEELLRLMNELTEQILHGAEGPQQKSAAMREVVDLIQQLIDPIVDRVGSVRSLAASVGISV